MLRRIISIFKRDLKVNLKDFISLYIFVIPVLFAIAINLFTPGINDTTINLALLEGENPEQVRYFKDFAKVELFGDIDNIKSRVKARDDIVAILPNQENYYIMSQGNEPKGVIEFAKILNSFYQLDIQIEDTNVEIKDFKRTIPPLKKQLVNTAILFISILGGMLIAINIVEEKVDNTISAINLTPTTRKTFILGKSIIGLLLAIFGSLVLIFITGFTDTNLIQLLMIVFVSTLLSLLVGFIQGLNNDDIMNAAGSIKLLFLPLIAGALAIELLADKWQKFFYWNPFYWAYKGNDAVLSKTGSWKEILFYSSMVLILSTVVYLFLAPKIRKGLE
ncbi:MAG: ABC transporter permease [Halanaerobiales bacterium]|nr:ABC transporter permease [Halanaerobiales bacterium]